jgi:hypothetical protein
MDILYVICKSNNVEISNIFLYVTISTRGRGQHREVKFKGWPITKEGTGTELDSRQWNWIPATGIQLSLLSSNRSYVHWVQGNPPNHQHCSAEIENSLS